MTSSTENGSSSARSARHSTPSTWAPAVTGTIAHDLVRNLARDCTAPRSLAHVAHEQRKAAAVDSADQSSSRFDSHVRRQRHGVPVRRHDRQRLVGRGQARRWHNGRARRLRQNAAAPRTRRSASVVLASSRANASAPVPAGADGAVPGATSAAAQSWSSDADNVQSPSSRSTTSPAPGPHRQRHQGVLTPLEQPRARRARSSRVRPPPRTWARWRCGADSVLDSSRDSPRTRHSPARRAANATGTPNSCAISCAAVRSVCEGDSHGGSDNGTSRQTAALVR